MRPQLAALVVLAACPAPRARLAAPGAALPAAPTLFSSVRVFDGLGEATRGPLDLLVAGGRIRALGAPGSLKVPENAARVDGTGRTLLPGLWDSHIHLGAGDGDAPWARELPDPRVQLAALLYCGVTSAVAASRDADTAELAAEVAAGVIAGPRLLRASRVITAREGHPLPFLRALIPWPLADLIVGGRIRQVSSADEAREAVRAEISSSRAPDFIKLVYNSMPAEAPHLSREALDAAIAEARRFGRRAIVHVGTPDDAVEAAEAGAAVLMHTPWDGVLDEARLKRIAATGAAVVSTQRIFDAMEAVANGRLPAWSDLEREVMKPGLAESWAHRPEGYPPPGPFDGFLREMTRYRREMAENVRGLRATGVTVLAGTDSGVPGVLHGAALHEELKALVSLGFTPGEALRAATSRPAQVWAADPRSASHRPDAGTGSPSAALRGVIAEGAVADLLLVEGDPAARIEDLSRIVGVWQEGRAVERRGPGGARGPGGVVGP